MVVAHRLDRCEVRGREVDVRGLRCVRVTPVLLECIMPLSIIYLFLSGSRVCSDLPRVVVVVVVRGGEGEWDVGGTAGRGPEEEEAFVWQRNLLGDQTRGQEHNAGSTC